MEMLSFPSETSLGLIDRKFYIYIYILCILYICIYIMQVVMEHDDVLFRIVAHRAVWAGAPFSVPRNFMWGF